MRGKRRAVRVPGRSPSIWLVGAHAALGQRQEALEAFVKAAQLNPQDTQARDHRLLALYGAGEKRRAFNQAERITERNPTDLVPRALLALRDDGQTARFAEAARKFVGEDDFEMLETALVFVEAGLIAEAETLLRAVCVEAVPEGERHALPLYTLAYFASLQGNPEAAQVYLEQATATYRDYEFASRPETVAILRYAVQTNPQDSHAHLHLGNLYAHLGRVDEAARALAAGDGTGCGAERRLSQSRALRLGGPRRISRRPSSTIAGPSSSGPTIRHSIATSPRFCWRRTSVTRPSS